MTPKWQLISVAFCFAAILSLAQMFFKFVSMGQGEASIVKTYVDNVGYLIVALTLYFGCFLIYPAILKHYPLNVFFPISTAATLVLVSLVGWLVFKEPITVKIALGMGFLLIGTFLVSAN